MNFLTQIIVLGKGSWRYNIDVLPGDALRLVRQPSDYDLNAFEIYVVASGYLAGHVGGIDLTEGMAGILDDLIEGVDYSINATSLQQNSFQYPDSITGYEIEVTLQFLSKLNDEKLSILLHCFDAALTKIES